MRVLLFTYFLLSATTLYASEWYLNGSLHKASVGQWKQSNYGNQLATAADWSLAFINVKDAVVATNTMQTLRPYATQLSTCINTAIFNAPIDGPIADIAVACALFMGWTAE